MPVYHIERDAEGNKRMVYPANVPKPKRVVLPERERLPDDQSPFGYTSAGNKRDKLLTDEERKGYSQMGNKSKRRKGTSHLRRIAEAKLLRNKSVSQVCRELGLDRRNLYQQIMKDPNTFQAYLRDTISKCAAVASRSLDEMTAYFAMPENERDIKTTSWILKISMEAFRTLKDIVEPGETTSQILTQFLHDNHFNLNVLREMASKGKKPKGMSDREYSRLLEIMDIRQENPIQEAELVRNNGDKDKQQGEQCLDLIPVSPPPSLPNQSETAKEQQDEDDDLQEF